jgi:uncharacterized membrane protein
MSFTDTAAKKAAVLSQSKSPSRKLYLFLGLAVLIGAGLAWFLLRPSGGPATMAQSQVGQAEAIALAAADFADGQARHYSLDAGGGIKVRYFVLQSSDGIIRAAFDACDVCWPAGRGYTQRGDFMVCNNCGQRFASTKVNEVKGGCNPAPLARRVEGEKVVLQVKDILAGRGYFDFSKARKGS